MKDGLLHGRAKDGLIAVLLFVASVQGAWLLYRSAERSFWIALPAISLFLLFLDRVRRLKPRT